MSETNRIEYKRELNTDIDLEKEVIAFLNYHEGGLIYIGIDKQGTSLGVSDIDGDMLKIKDRIKNNISPSAMGLFDVVAETLEGKGLIKIIVAGGTEKPYFKKKFGMTEKGCFIRIGTAAEPMPQAMIDKLFASRTRNSLGKIRSHRQDLTFEQLKIYYEEKGLTLTKRFKQNLELLTEDEKLNYVAYLLGDENGTSIKVAKYSGTDRVDLIENNEYGYCSLIKATKRVIDKLELENKTISKITSKERIDTRLWNAVALREAIINAIIHNDYTREVPPKFEIFSDRLEITSYGGLFDGMTQEDFFDGLSLPRNKELMRVYKDLGMVEQLGSGVPRILQAYSKDCFKFSENYLRMTFLASEKLSTQVTTHVTTQVTTQVEELIKIFTGEHTRQDLQAKLNLANRENFRKNYLQSALDEGLIELTIPDKPKSSKQKYRLTEKAILMKNSMT
ncbi:MAG: putative DNA binding domain-containing protein [Bacteroidales bacterium]|nr:putative DNA binding domain-containing protein [Bacteroidales bacterium]